MRFLLLLLLIVGLIGITDAAAQKKRKIRKAKPPAVPMKRVDPPVSTIPSGEFKDLLVENQSGVEEPFIFVARSAAQYGELQKKVSNLPSVDAINFNSNAVVAAFAGTKPTPGYDIVFSKTANGVKVDLTAPPKDAMLAQVLTSPARIIVVPVEAEQEFKVEADANWQGKMQSYSITSGAIKFSGGFAGIEHKYALAGTLSIMRMGDYVSLFFNAAAADDKKRRMLETATGVIKANSVRFERIDAGTMVDNPRPPFKAMGEIVGNKLKLNFEPLPTNVADGYEGSGSLEATLIK